MKRHVLKQITITVAGAAIALLLMTPNSTRAQPEGTFRQAHDVGNGAMSSLDPISNGRVLMIINKVMSRLLRPDAGGVPSPDLATHWETNEDGSEWIFHLRDGVTFHDGSTLDAEDVIYTFERVLDPERDSPVRPVIGMIEKLEAPDPLTVRMQLSTGFADLPLQLMDYRLRIIPEGSDDTIAETGIGSGPFYVERFDPDGISVLRAFDDYWEGTPELAEIEVIGIPDSQARLQAFLGGQIDIDLAIAPHLKDALQRTQHIRLQEVATGNWSGIAMRTDIAPFDDVKVRRAIRLAVDREQLLKVVLGGRGVVSCDTPVAPDDPYRADMTCPRDLEQARALLAEAGYPDGLDAEIVISNLDPSWQPLAIAIQSQAAEAGIRLKIKQAASDGYWSEVWGKKPVCLTSWGARPADQILNEAFHSEAKWNETHFKDPKFDAMLSEARSEIDFAARKALYVDAQEYLAENSGTLIPFHVSQLVGLSSRVQNLPPIRQDAIRWHEVSLAAD